MLRNCGSDRHHSGDDIEKILMDTNGSQFVFCYPYQKKPCYSKQTCKQIQFYFYRKAVVSQVKCRKVFCYLILPVNIVNIVNIEGPCATYGWQGSRRIVRAITDLQLPLLDVVTRSEVLSNTAVTDTAWTPLCCSETNSLCVNFSVMFLKCTSLSSINFADHLNSEGSD